MYITVETTTSSTPLAFPSSVIVGTEVAKTTRLFLFFLGVTSTINTGRNVTLFIHSVYDVMRHES